MKKNLLLKAMAFAVVFVLSAKANAQAPAAKPAPPVKKIAAAPSATPVSSPTAQLNSKRSQAALNTSTSNSAQKISTAQNTTRLSAREIVKKYQTPSANATKVVPATIYPQHIVSASGETPATSNHPAVNKQTINQSATSSESTANKLPQLQGQMSTSLPPQ